MTTFSYTSGDPDNLTAGSAADMSDISGPFADVETFLNGNISDVNIAANGVDNDNLDATTVTDKLGLSQTGTVRRGKCIIATEEARTNVAYGTLTTPDQVSSVVLPTDGLIAVSYTALWKESVSLAARAAIFLGSTQVKAQAATAPAVNEASLGSTANTYGTLWSNGGGGLSGATGLVGSHVTTGQLAGGGFGWDGQVSYIFAAAGTYDVSIRFKASSGSVTAKERKLWVWTMGF